MDAGAEVFDYGNSIRGEAQLAGYERAFDFPGFVPAYIRPLFCEGKGPFRWAALSGDPQDIAATDQALLDLFPENESLARWIRLAGERVHFQGLPARICWLGYGERDKAGERFNDMVASGELAAPLVIGRDHLDCGSVASPYRETEAMLDGSDAIADWPLLNAMVNVASGASWVSIHHGGGVGMGRSIHAGQVTVADGTALAGEKIRRVLTNDPGMGVIRHVDAGYDIAESVADERGVRVPMREGDGVTDEPATVAERSGARSDGTAADRRPSRRCGATCARRPARRHRRLPPLRLDRRRRRLPGLVPRAGRGPRAGLRGRPQRQPVGLARRPRAPGTPSSPARTWTPCPTAAPSTGPSASSPPSPRSTNSARGARSSPGRSPSSTSATRRAPASASPASAPGSPPGS